MTKAIGNAMGPLELPLLGAALLLGGCSLSLPNEIDDLLHPPAPSVNKVHPIVSPQPVIFTVPPSNNPIRPLPMPSAAPPATAAASPNPISNANPITPFASHPLLVANPVIPTVSSNPPPSVIGNQLAPSPSPSPSIRYTYNPVIPFSPAPSPSAATADGNGQLPNTATTP